MAPMTNPQYGSASVVDIVSFGYKKMFENLWPLTRMCLPILILNGVTWGMIQQEMVGFQDRKDNLSLNDLLQMGLSFVVLFFVSILLYYLMYAIVRYCRDLYRDELEEPWYQYLFPKKSLLGVLGLGFLQVAASIPAIVIIVIGFLFLIVPGVAMLMLFGYGCYLVYLVYIDKPERGVFDSIRYTVELVKPNWLRTIGLACVVTLINMIISIPFSVVSSIISAVAQLMPSLQQSFLYFLTNAVLYTAMYWVQMVIGVGGVAFVLYRYLFDMEYRQASEAAIADEKLQNRIFPASENR